MRKNTPNCRKSKRFAAAYFAVVPFLLILGCASTDVNRQPLESISELVADEEFKSSESVGCEAMFDRYCDSLYSPEAMGNLRIGKDKDTFKVFRGRTQNGFSATYYFYARAKLDRRRFLPLDFRRALDEQGYFQQLSQALGRAPHRQMSLEDRMTDIRRDYLLGSQWTSSLEQTIMRRLHESHPELHRLPDDMIPVDVRKEKRKVRRKLISEISTALWQDHRNWVKVTESFEVVRRHLRDIIQELDLAQAVKDQWMKRVNGIRIVLPGSIPELADEECATTGTNAFYFPQLNVITVCAGDFNSEDIYQTLAHEAAHAVDVDSMANGFRSESRLAKQTEKLQRMVCGKSKWSCDTWAQYKEGFGEGLGDWESFDVDMPEVQSCLKSRSPTRPLSSSALEAVARKSATETFAALAEENAFVRLIQPKLPLPDGKWIPNANHFNVCRYLSLDPYSDLFDEETAALLFFVSEYRCAPGKNSDRMRGAVSLARDMTAELKEAELSMLGELSPSPHLTREGYAASPSERFSDLLGSHLLARVLGNVPDRWSRRKLYFASNAWQCPKPSLVKYFPDLAVVERDLTFDSHSSGRERQRECLSAPVRSALGCQKDFEFKECELPYKSDS